MIESGAAALLLLLGIWAALDGTSVAQVMVSRPLVSGTLAGAVLGAPQVGLTVGAILEGAHLGQLPVGAVRLPEPGPAAVPAVLAAVLLGGAGGIALGVALGVVWSLLGGGTMVLVRRANGRLVQGLEEGRLSRRQVVRRHWGAIGLDGLRGGVLTGSGIAAAAGLVATGADGWPLSVPSTIAFLLLPGALAAGVLLRTWALTRRRWVLLLAGVLAGWAVSGGLG